MSPIFEQLLAEQVTPRREAVANVHEDVAYRMPAIELQAYASARRGWDEAAA